VSIATARARRDLFLPGSMHRYVPAKKYGTAKIVHDTPGKLERLRGAMHGQPLDCDVYTRLIVGNVLWMTDTEFEWRSNLEAVSRLSGDVLIAGLGIGFILRPILKRADVKSVTVIERSADVIALVAPHYPTVKVIQVDARDWEPPKRAYDAIYLDIWHNVPNSDDREDIKSLKRRYRSALRKGGWIAAWCEDYAKR
jgi:hypothetical protein